MKYDAASRTHWIAPSEKDTASATLDERLWAAAEQAGLAPYTGLNSQECSGGRPQGPLLGKVLQRQIHNFRRTRDLLLPRLLSGNVKFN